MQDLAGLWNPNSRQSWDGGRVLSKGTVSLYMPRKGTREPSSSSKYWGV